MEALVHIPSSFIAKILESINRDGKFVPTLFLRTKNRADYLQIISLDNVPDRALKRDIYIVELGQSIRNGKFFSGIEGLEFSGHSKAEESEDSRDFSGEEIEPVVDEIIEACLVVEVWKIKWSYPKNEANLIISKEKIPDAVMVSYKSNEVGFKSKVHCFKRNDDGKIISSETTSENYTTNWEPKSFFSSLFNANF